MPGGLYPPLDLIFSWTPNYVNPETRGWSLVILVCVLLGLVYIVVGLRLYARFILTKNSGLDDYFIIFNLVPLTGLAVALCLSSKKYGFDRHLWDNTQEVLVDSRKITMVIEFLYMLSTSTTKISILLFYHRLAAGTVTKTFRRVVHGAIIFVVLYFVVFSTVLFLTCRPFKAYWMLADLVWRSTNEYHCIDEPADLIAAAVASAIQDFLACGIPMVLFWNVRIPRRQKLALVLIFGVGFFLCICAIIRITVTMPIYFTTYDMTWESWNGWTWLTIESHVALICASAPALKIFFKKLLEVTRSKSNASLPSSWRNKFGSKGTYSRSLNKTTEKMELPWRGPEEPKSMVIVTGGMEETAAAEEGSSFHFGDISGDAASRIADVESQRSEIPSRGSSVEVQRHWSHASSASSQSLYHRA
ncbi:hypothetical protein EJ06DRAFT_505542 [Trichodelitschia bisporula]|uniref:Rhodopsin domain-containing protein n=1 Tax=Trichodelitschia bisporula TaxID=703511 RepID=A0A6G1I701_9PEZI|nr:hypothetical protein EJ06DRAFT_505542 [Trichodelitschia bisporula]